MATDLLERIYKLTVEGGAAEKELKRIANSTTQLEDAFNKVSTSVKRFGAGLVAGLTVGAAVGAIKGAIDALDEAFEASQKLGLSVESLSEWNFALKQAGVSSESFATGVGKLSQSMGDLATGKVTDATKALERFGVAAGDTTDQALDKLVKGFSEMEAGPRKTAAAMDIFGKSGKDLIPLLNEGTEGIAKFREEVRRLGGVMSTEAARRANEFNDNMAKLGTAAKAVGLQIAEGLLPPLVKLSTQLVQNAQDFGLVQGAAVTAFEAMFGTAFERKIEAYNNALLERKQLEEQIARQGHMTEVDKARLDALDATIKKLQAEKDLIDDLRRTREAADKAAADAAAARAKAKGTFEADAKAAEAEKAAIERLQKLAAGLKEQREAREAMAKGIDQAEASIRKFTLSQDDLNKGTFNAVALMNDENRVRGELNKTIEETAAKKRDEALATEQLYQWLVTGTEAQMAYAKATLEAREAANVHSKALEKQKTEMDVLSQGTEQFFDNMASGVADFEDVFKRTVQSIIAELLKIWAKKYIIDFVMGMFGGGQQSQPFMGGGGIAAPFAAAPQAVATPTSTAPQVRGLSSSMDTANSVAGGNFSPMQRTSESGAPKVEINVHNNAGAQVDVQASDDGSRIDITIERVRRALAGDVARGGTVFSRAMETTYALGRARGG